jgi:hypothetical protein
MQRESGVTNKGKAVGGRACRVIIAAALKAFGVKKDKNDVK